MPEPATGFPSEEFAARTARAQELMAQSEMAGILLTTEAEVRYFSGFHTLFWQSPTRPWFLFVPASGKPIAVIPEIGADLMRHTWVDDIRTWPSPRPSDDGTSLLVDLLQTHSGLIGIPMGPETHLRMPLTQFQSLQKALPDCRFADATAIIRSLRMVKSDREIAKISHICAIASDAFDRVPGIVQDGQPLNAVFRAFRRELLACGAEDVPYLVGGAQQGGYTDVISPPSARPLSRGDILMMDTGATWDGYFCDFDRNWAIGAADADSIDTHDRLWEATEAGLDALRPGVTCRDVMTAMAKITGATGDVGRFGHGLGMQLTEWPSFAAFDDTVVCENMVLTLEPSVSYGDGHIMVHEENVVMRADGPELLSRRAPAHLPVI